MKFSIPYNADKNLLASLFNSKLAGHIKEIYFAGNPLKVPSGRRPKIKDFIHENGNGYYFDHVNYDKDIEKMISLCRSRGVECNLLLNFAGTLTREATKYVGELIEKGVSILTIGNKQLLLQVQSELKFNYKIQNSVYLKISNTKDIINLVKSGISILLLPPEKNHNLHYIGEIKEILKEFDIEYMLMVNEGCLIDCEHRAVDQVLSQKYSISSTIRDYLDNPDEVRALNQPCRAYMNEYGIMKTNFIHPGNISEYEHFDLIYKIVGRSFHSRRILKAVQSYVEGTYLGDLRDIVENFKHSRDPVYFGKNQKTRFVLEGENGAG